MNKIEKYIWFEFRAMPEPCFIIFGLKLTLFYLKIKKNGKLDWWHASTLMVTKLKILKKKAKAPGEIWKESK